MKNRVMATSFGDIKIVNFEEFIKNIAIKHTCDSRDSYEIALADNKYNQFDDMFNRFDRYHLNFNRLSINLYTLDGFLNNLKYSLVRQLGATTTIATFTNSIEMLNDFSIQSATQLGCPTMAVKVSARKWLIANPKDFNLIKNGKNQFGIACYYPARNLLIDIKRTIKKKSEDHVLDAIRYETYGLNWTSFFGGYNDDIVCHEFIKTVNKALSDGVDQGTLIYTDSVCECGKEKHGFQSHSTWCPKHE